MSKESNDAWVNAHYGHDAHPITDSKPAAAQEAVYQLRSTDDDRAWVDCTEGEFNWWQGRSRESRKLFAADPVAAAPGIAPHAPYTESVYALARKLLWIAYVWNDHNFDHPYKIARKMAAEFGIESFDQANAWLDEQSKVIDASPKRGSMSDCPIIRLAPGEYTDFEKRVWRRGVIEAVTQPDIALAANMSALIER